MMRIRYCFIVISGAVILFVADTFASDPITLAQSAFKSGNHKEGLRQISSLVEDDNYYSGSVILDGAKLLEENGHKDRAIQFLRSYLKSAKRKKVKGGYFSEVQAALTRMTGTYERPPIPNEYLSQSNKMTWYCRYHALVGSGRLGRYLGEQTINKVQSGQKEALFYDPLAFISSTVNSILGSVPVSSTALREMGCWTLDQQPALTMRSSVSCGPLTDDIVNILWPYCVSDSPLGNECSALNVHLADSAANFGSKFDQAFKELIDLILAHETGNKIDLFAEALRISRKYVSNQTEGSRLAILLLGAVGNDNEVPYFADQFNLALISHPERRDSLKEYLTTDKFKSAIMRAGVLMNRDAFEGVDKKQGSAGLHHYIAGLVIGCELARKGWDTGSAQWAGFFTGAVYETQDYVSHAQTGRGSEPAWIENFKADTDGHSQGALKGAQMCSN